MNHIRDKLPDMKARLNTLMGQAQQELNSFGDAAIFGDKNQVYRLEHRLTNPTHRRSTARFPCSTPHDTICERLHFFN
jgi:hypothetical protein